MAKRSSVSASRSVDEVAGAAVPGWDPPDAVTKLLERERLRMMRARTILQCITLAMEQPMSSEQQPCYSDAIEVACDLIDEAVQRLDRIQVRQAGAAKGAHDPMPAPPGGHMVREPAKVYRIERCPSVEAGALLGN